MNKRILTQQMDALFANRFKPEEPGAAVIVVRDGTTIFRKGYGTANVELGVPIRPDMVFRLGSITKQFTAVAILMLADRSKLSLQDRISKYIPRYPMHGHKITIEHLLTHTSGIKDFTSMPEFHQEAKEDKSVIDHIALFKDQPMVFAPGERHEYNNSGYFLLGAIIENITGQTYEEFLQRNIFDKLGMNNTYYDLPSKIIPGRVCGYSKGTDGIQNASYISMTRPYAGGSLASSVDDLAKWDAALYTNKLLKQSTRKKAWTPYRLSDGNTISYGYGWAISPYHDHTIIQHGGGISGFINYAIRVPEKRVYVAVLTNSLNPAAQPRYISLKLAALAIDEPLQDPVAISLSKSTLQQFAGQYTVINNPMLTISVKCKGNQLYAQFAPGAPPIEIYPHTPSAFFMKDALLQLHFVSNPDDRDYKLQLWDQGVLLDTAVRSSNPNH